MASGTQFDVGEGCSGSQDFPDLFCNEYLGFSIEEITEDLTRFGGIEQRYPKCEWDVLLPMAKDAGDPSTAEGNGNFWESYWPVPPNDKVSYPCAQPEAHEASLAKPLKLMKSDFPDNIVFEPANDEGTVVKAEDGDAPGGYDVRGLEHEQKSPMFLNHEPSSIVKNPSEGVSSSQFQTSHTNMSEESFNTDFLKKFEEYSGYKLCEDEPYNEIYDFDSIPSPLGSDGKVDFHCWNDNFLEQGQSSNKRIPVSLKDGVPAVEGVRKIEINTFGTVSTETVKLAQNEGASVTFVQARKEELQLQDDRESTSGFEESCLVNRRVKKHKIDPPSTSLPRAKRSVHEIIYDSKRENQNPTAAGAQGKSSGKKTRILIPLQDLKAALKQDSFVLRDLGGEKVIRFTLPIVAQDDLKTASFRTTSNVEKITPVSPTKLNHNDRKTTHVLMTPNPNIEMTSPVSSPVKDENGSFNSSLTSLSSSSTTSSANPPKKKKSKIVYAKQRMRRLDLSKSFKDLQKCIPSIARNPKCSKLKILTCSQKFIKELNTIQKRIQRDKMHYKKHNAQLKATLEKAKYKV